MHAILQDVRIAVRGYLATPLFTIVVLSILGLAIGANSAIFSVVNAVLLRPLDYPQSSALVSVSQRDRVTQRRRSISPPNYFDLKEQAHAFAAIAAYWSPSVNLSGDGVDPEKVQAATCSYDLFGVLGVNVSSAARSPRTTMSRARGGWRCWGTACGSGASAATRPRSDAKRCSTACRR